MGRWRALGARSKADHVVDALRPRRAAAGHAGGDRLRRRRAAGRARRARARAGARRLRALAARGRDRAGARRRRAADRGVRRRATCPAEDGAYDLAVLSHVLEHVPEPMSLLREAARVAPAVLVEVPLEDNRSAAARREARGGGADRPHPVLRPRRGARAARASPGCAWPPSSPTPSPTPTTRSSPRRAASARRRRSRPACGARRGGRAPRRRSGSSPSTTRA